MSYRSLLGSLRWVFSLSSHWAFASNFRVFQGLWQVVLDPWETLLSPEPVRVPPEGMPRPCPHWIPLHSGVSKTLLLLSPRISYSYSQKSASATQRTSYSIFPPYISYMITIHAGHWFISQNFQAPLQPHPSFLYPVGTHPHHISNYRFYFVCLPGDILVKLCSQSILETSFPSLQ